MVSFKKKKTWDKPFSEKVARRVKRIATPELTIWADQTIYELSRLLNIYSRVRTPEAMKELLLSAEALHAVIDELDKRL
jgi:hypothetical protein